MHRCAHVQEFQDPIVFGSRSRCNDKNSDYRPIQLPPFRVKERPIFFVLPWINSIGILWPFAGYKLTTENRYLDINHGLGRKQIILMTMLYLGTLCVHRDSSRRRALFK